MERQTDLAEAIDTVADGARYDNCAKKLLAFKAIDAWILKYCTKEFSFYSVEYIMEHCMTGKVEVSEHGVHQDQLNKNRRTNGNEQITKMNSESSSINEVQIPGNQHARPDRTACCSASNGMMPWLVSYIPCRISRPLHSRRYALDVIRLRHASA